MTIITVKHNFETAHRLPFIQGKCENLHGHSWWATWEIEAPIDDNGLTIEYGVVKHQIRRWVDENLDHGSMLGAADSLITNGHELLLGKTFIFGRDYIWRPWPTVEAVAEMLSSEPVRATGLNVVKVTVQETHVNSAIWTKEA